MSRFHHLPLVFLLFTYGIYAKVEPMIFYFEPMKKISKIEVELKTTFGSGSVIGFFPDIRGQIAFAPEVPEKTSGQVILDPSKLQFSYHKVNSEAQNFDWLDSKQHRLITFELKKFNTCRWEGRKLFAMANGKLKIKGIEKEINFPLRLRHFREERKDFDKKEGDLLMMVGELKINRGDFGLNPGYMLDQVLEEIIVKVTLIGCSNRVRPLLPSPLFEN